MTARKRERRRLDLAGLEAAPSQVVGAVRLVPLLRDEPLEGLQLYSLPYEADLTVARLDERTAYVSYVPHGLVATLSPSDHGAAGGAAGRAHASLGTQLARPKARPAELFRVQVLHRLARREGADALRMLPQHLALDAYLSVGFGGPSVAWPEYSREVLSRGLSPRVERTYRGGELSGLADALRVFELHPGQVGVLVFVADAFASAFVTPRPEDYRRLHRTLLLDMYGELLVQYAVLYPEARALWQPLRAGAIDSLDALAEAVAGLRRQWSAFAGLMASGLVEAELELETVQRLGGFRLLRMLPSFHPHADNHVGEAIVDAQGRVAYLKTFRLSAAQARRGRLLSTLVAVDWELEAAAEALGATREELLARLRNNGLGHVLRPGLR